MSHMNKLSRTVKNLVKGVSARERLSWGLNSNLSDSKDTLFFLCQALDMSISV